MIEQEIFSPEKPPIKTSFVLNLIAPNSTGEYGIKEDYFGTTIFAKVVMMSEDTAAGDFPMRY